MAVHYHATSLKQYFKAVMDWVELNFPNYRGKLMKGLDWGLLYNQYHVFVIQISRRVYMNTCSVRKQRKRHCPSVRFPIIKSSLCTNGKQMSAPSALPKVSRKSGAIEEMHADNFIPWSKGSHTALNNGQTFCWDHNLVKVSK